MVHQVGVMAPVLIIAAVSLVFVDLDLNIVTVLAVLITEVEVQRLSPWCKVA